MLIYNFQKEFLGIDEKDLRTLGFKNLQGLRAEVTDFSDLFVKTPGYIHNFKHVHWIDFITCAESNEESKVIINVNNKNYTASVHITTAFLVDNPSSKAFLVNLNNLRELTAKESEKISGDIVQRELPTIQQETKKIFNTPEIQPDIVNNVVTEDIYEKTVEATVTQDPYETPLDVNMDDTPLEVEGFEEELKPIEIQKSMLDEELTVAEENSYNDAPLEIDIEDDFDTIEIEEEVEVVVKPQHPAKHIEIIKESFDNGYVYDPTVASDELGLPLDLIEEFIQDFIEQAKEFKDDLYKSLNENDLDNLKILSHKLKGVAANLRIEDALETITVVNTDSNINIISENLDTFYKIIAKLAGETITIEKEVEDDLSPTQRLEATQEKDELDLYVDPVEIDDADVPQKIEMPELADDTFLDSESESIEVVDETPDEEFKIEIDIEDEDEVKIAENTTDDFTIADHDFKIDIDTEDEVQLAENIDIEINTDDATNTPEDLDTLELTVDNTDAPEHEREEEKIEINYSKEAVANEIGLDLESFNELFEDYIQEVKELLASIKESMVTNNTQAIRAEAIKLKGMSDNMRVEAFSYDIGTLLNSHDGEDLRSAIENIDKTIEQLSSREV